MSTPPLPGTSDSFNEPATDDPTSAPQIQQQNPSPVIQALAKKPKKGKNPSALAGMIARAKHAKQSSYKYGG